MSAVAVERPLVGRFIPEEGARRVAALAGFAVLGTLILWASAKVSVPFWPVPMNLQTMAVAGIAALYGSRLGALTVALYVAEGAAGLPVFTGTPQQGIGLAYLMGPTGGYLLGMPLAAWLIGWLVERGLAKSVFSLFAVMLAGDVIVFALGLAWLGTVIGWDKPVLAFGLYPFVLGDLMKLALAACIVTAAGRLVRR
jgi:biotin transport system substrate-specific component